MKSDIAQWIGWLRAANRSRDTIEQRTYHVSRALREIAKDPWLEITVDDLAQWLGSKDWKPNTIRAYRNSLRSFYAWGQATGRRLDSPAHLLPPVQVPRALPRPAPDRVIEVAMLEAPQRLRLMLELAAICGLRRKEVAKVNRDDVSRDGEGYALRVTGKGGHVRMVPLPRGLAVEILAQPSGWLFPNKWTGRPITPAYAGKLISHALADDWTCHTLRHRCGTVAYWGSMDLRAVQELLGHAKVETTQLYTFVRPEQIRKLLDVTVLGSHRSAS